MTTCTRCGQPVYPGASTCQTCGAYLAPTAQAGQPPNGTAPFGGGQWQAPDAAPYPGGQPNGGAEAFSASSLVSNDALPEWLVQASSGALGPTPGGSGGLRANGAGGYGAQPQGYGAGGYGAQPQGYGQPAQYGGNGQMPGSGGLGQPPVGPSYGSSSRELFDESALPDWLRQPSSGGGADMAQQATAYQPAAMPNGAYNGYGAGPARYAAPPNPAPSYGGPQYADPRYAPAPQYGASQQRGVPNSSQYSAMPPGPAYSPAGYGGYPATPPQQGGRSGVLGQAPFAGPSPAGAFPSIESAGASQMNRAAGMPAHTLIDSGALPGWLAGQPNSAPAVSGGLANGDGMSAHSLIDEAALPQWLRAQPAASPARAMPRPPATAAAPVAPWSAPATADEPLPGWLNQVYVEANVPRVEPSRIPSGWLAPQAPMSPPSDRYAGAAGGGFSASAFVDESALPEWLKSQGGVPAQGSAQPSQMLTGSYVASATPSESRDFGSYVPQGAQAAQTARTEDDGPARFSVSDLIDPEALPSWVSGQSASVGAAWTNNQPAAQTAGSSTLRREAASARDLPTGAETDGGGWDEPNVPAWMRALGEDQDGQPSAAYQGASSVRGQSGDLARGGHLDPSASATWRRGQPIPSAELPPWLRAPNAARDGAGARGADYGYQQSGREPMARADGWPEDAPRETEWTDWDEPGYNDADYDAGAGYQDDRDQRREKQRGGWRRLFGRG